MTYKIRTIVCLNCAQEKTGRFSSRRQFCDVACRQQYRNHPSRNPSTTIEARKKISESRKGKPTTLGRAHSNETKKRISNSLKKFYRTHPGINTGKKLSKETRQKISQSRKGKFLGSQNPNWRGGTSPRDWRRARYREFLRQVWARDRGICQDCGISTGKREVHHIQSWIDAPELRYEPANGVLLCASCHWKKEKHIIITAAARKKMSAFAQARPRNPDGTFTKLQPS